MNRPGVPACLAWKLIHTASSERVHDHAQEDEQGRQEEEGGERPADRSSAAPSATASWADPPAGGRITGPARTVRTGSQAPPGRSAPDVSRSGGRVGIPRERREVRARAGRERARPRRRGRGSPPAARSRARRRPAPSCPRRGASRASAGGRGEGTARDAAGSGRSRWCRGENRPRRRAPPPGSRTSPCRDPRRRGCPVAGRPDLVADAIAGEEAFRAVAEAVRDDVAGAEAGELVAERPIVGAPGPEEEREPGLAGGLEARPHDHAGSVRPQVAGRR